MLLLLLLNESYDISLYFFFALFLKLPLQLPLLLGLALLQHGVHEALDPDLLFGHLFQLLLQVVAALIKK